MCISKQIDSGIQQQSHGIIYTRMKIHTTSPDKRKFSSRIYRLAFSLVEEPCPSTDHDSVSAFNVRSGCLPPLVKRNDKTLPAPRCLRPAAGCCPCRCLLHVEADLHAIQHTAEQAHRRYAMASGEHISGTN